ncbi:Cold regulated protein 27, putative isoform 4 [Hibiscus syriacus]|uniref:Cold regulated protein 27, putative isoform 4 n=1 Tax=Hibiscus syriacus TaxID=106335 RepID=A0A6A3AJ73_HIBSY|nr:Cold regulated protein 27, putative isoform 4 [Hibiscus syriacus]
MEGLRRTESWTSSEASSSESLSRPRPPRFSQQQQQVPNLDSSMNESTSKEWTDEKHNLYLKSIEASFVDQLYVSKGFLRYKSQTDKFPGSRLTHCTTSGQFKVLRGGCWKKINFETPGFRQNKRDLSSCFMASPWIQHFRSGSDSGVFASCSHLEGHASSKGKTDNSTVKESNFLYMIMPFVTNRLFYKLKKHPLAVVAKHILQRPRWSFRG